MQDIKYHPRVKDRDFRETNKFIFCSLNMELLKNTQIDLASLSIYVEDVMQGEYETATHNDKVHVKISCKCPPNS